MSRQSICSVASTITVGLDPGDRFSRYSEMDFETGVIAEGRLRTTPDALRRPRILVRAHSTVTTCSRNDPPG